MTFNLASPRIRNSLSRGAFAVGVLLLATGQPLAAEFKAGPLVITNPWARATPPGAKVGGGYMTIENTGGESDRLVSAASGVAGRVEVHEMKVVDGVMKMRPLENGLEVPASGSVELKPGSYHIMLMGLKHSLKEGESFKGTLTFEKAGSVDVTYAVGPVGSMTAPGHDMGQ